MLKYVAGLESYWVVFALLFVMLIVAVELVFFAWLLGLVLAYFGYITPLWVRISIILLANIMFGGGHTKTNKGE